MEEQIHCFEVFLYAACVRFILSTLCEATQDLLVSVSW